MPLTRSRTPPVTAHPPVTAAAQSRAAARATLKNAFYTHEAANSPHLMAEDFGLTSQCSYVCNLRACVRPGRRSGSAIPSEMCGPITVCPSILNGTTGNDPRSAPPRSAPARPAPSRPASTHLAQPPALAPPCPTTTTLPAPPPTLQRIPRLLSRHELHESEAAVAAVKLLGQAAGLEVAERVEHGLDVSADRSGSRSGAGRGGRRGGRADGLRGNGHGRQT